MVPNLQNGNVAIAGGVCLRSSSIFVDFALHL